GEEISDLAVVKEWNISGENQTSDLSKAIRYFSNPNSEGNFKASAAREHYIDGTSIFKFTLNSDSEAVFEFCHDQNAVKMALNNWEEIIKSVAEELNAFNPHASSIISEPNDRGVAVLNDGSWEVTRKVKIRYA